MTDMTTGDIRRQLLSLMFPIFLTNLGCQVYSVVDSLIVGRGVGVHALAAVGATDWVYWFFSWTMSSIVGGLSTFASRSFGKGDMCEVSQSLVTSTRVCLSLSISLGLLGYFTAPVALGWLHTPEELLEMSTVYLRLLLIGGPAVNTYVLLAATLRGLGDGRTPLLAMALSSSLNIVLDLLAVLVFDTGVVGAAVATIIAESTACLYCWWKLKKIPGVNLNLLGQPSAPKLAADMLAFSLPLGVGLLAVCSGGFALQFGVNRQGSNFVAGYTAANRVYSVLECAGMALKHAMLAFASQNVGSGNESRVQAGFVVGMRIAIVVSLSTTALAVLTARPCIVTLLGNSADCAEAVEVGCKYLIAMGLAFPLLFCRYCMDSTLNARGVSHSSMLSGCAEAMCRVLCALVLLDRIGTTAIYLSEPLSWLLAFLTTLLIFYRRKFKCLKESKSLH